MLVRLNEDHRGGADRYGIARITNNENKKSVLVLMLGHNVSDAIYMPYDIRKALGADKGAVLDFEIEKVGRFGKLKWYLSVLDPAVHIPGWIALIGIAVGVIGIAVGAMSLF